jgi:hypothetical protein
VILENTLREQCRRKTHGCSYMRRAAQVFEPTTIQPAIVGHAKTSHHKHTPKKRSSSAANRDGQGAN